MVQLSKNQRNHKFLLKILDGNREKPLLFLKFQEICCLQALRSKKLFTSAGTRKRSPLHSLLPIDVMLTEFYGVKFVIVKIVYDIHMSN